MISAVAWAPFGVLLTFALWALVQREFRTQDIPMPPIVPIVLMCSVWGFIAGVTFASILVLFERRQTVLTSISTTRVVVFGAMAGAALPALLPHLPTISFVSPIAIATASIL